MTTSQTVLDPAQWNRQIRELEQKNSAEIAVAFHDLESGQEYGYRDQEMMHAASTMKVPVMIEVFRQVEAGRFALDDSVAVHNVFHSIVDGSPFTLEVTEDGEATLYSLLGRKTTIRHLVEQMITWSSNLATNLLIELVDATRVTRTCRLLGADSIQVLRGVEDIKAYQQGLNNRTTARDLRIILQAIAERRAASPAACDSMIAILERQHYRSKIPAGLPENWRVANKTGSITRIDHDAAIVFPPGRKPYILVVLTRGIDDHTAAERVIAEISRRVAAAVQARTATVRGREP